MVKVSRENEVDLESDLSKSESSSDYIRIKKDNLWKYSTFVLIGILIIGGFFVFSGNIGGGGTVGTGQVINNPSPTLPGPTGNVKVSVDDDAVLGDKKAPVTIVEFSDYQCPFCRRFFTQTLGQVKSEYINTGKVKLVFRDFPLSFHPSAQPAAEAAECVRAEGGDEAYYKMHDKIFEEQEKLGQGTVQFSEDDIKRWAKELGYSIDSCLDSGKFKNEVLKDLNDAQASGGQGTPYFVIIGKDGSTIPISGAQPFSAFDAALKAAGA